MLAPGAQSILDGLPIGSMKSPKRDLDADRELPVANQTRGRGIPSLSFSSADFCPLNMRLWNWERWSPIVCQELVLKSPRGSVMWACVRTTPTGKRFAGWLGGEVGTRGP
jgi:hypothetical protein